MGEAIPEDLRGSNVLFVMVDQLPPQLTGTYGHDVVETPNLDRLATDGVRFDDAYTPSPMCGPARASIMTGRHVAEIGVWDNAAPLADDEITYAHYLANEGYDPVLSGKMHLVGADQLHGFDRRLTTDIFPEDFSWTPYREVDAGGSVGPEAHAYGGHVENYVAEGNVEIGQWSQYLSFDEETQFRAIEYLNAKGIEAKEGRDPEPFHITVSFHHPHDQFWPPAEYFERYENAPIHLPDVPDDLEGTYSKMDEWLNEWHGTDGDQRLLDPDSLRHVRRAYYALVSYVDEKLGELLDALEGNGLAKDTIVIFTSDHGEMLGERGMVQKRCFYEWSSRVPLVARFPDGVNAGEICDTPVSLLDLLPTFLDIAGVDAEDRLPYDGHSLFETLAGEHDDRIIFSEFYAEGVHAPCFMARQNECKYVKVHGHDEQLFDLDADPGEWTDVVDARPEVAKGLRNAIERRFDPDALDEKVNASIRRRTLIREAMEQTGVNWAYDPAFDPTRDIHEQYLPE